MGIAKRKRTRTKVKMKPKKKVFIANEKLKKLWDLDKTVSQNYLDIGLKPDVTDLFEVKPLTDLLKSAATEGTVAGYPRIFLDE